MIYGRTNGIPQQRAFLPFVNQPWNSALKQLVWTGLSKNTI